MLLHAYYNPDLIDIIAAALGMYYFGIHMAASLVASERGVSMEGHVFGFLAGGLTGAFYSKIAPTVITTANYLGLYLS